MKPWETVDRAQAPDGTELVLARRGGEWVVRAGGRVLVTSRTHGSEEALAEIALSRVERPRTILVGGLGLGFTLRAALDVLPRDAQVTLVELVPEVVGWNREHLGDLARRPLDDPRVKIRMGDVAQVIAEHQDHWHAILLDVDNGPDAFTSPANAALYGLKGLIAARRALVPGGTFAVWSVENDNKFTDRMRGAAFEVDKQRVPARPGSTVKHVIWIGRRMDKRSERR